MMVAMRPVMVDPWRSGGMLGSRNFFSVLPPVSIRRFAIAQAQPVTVSTWAATTIGTAIDRAIDAIDRELEAASVEADLVSPAALRVQPEDYTQIGLVGTVLAPQEIRSVILADARALDGQVSRIGTGALSHYLSAAQSQRLKDLHAKADRLVQYLQGLDIQVVRSQNMTVANQHVDGHLLAPVAAIRDAEKAVVTAEAGNVPVLEPSEQTLPKGLIVAGVGVIAGVGILLWSLLS